MRYTQIFSCLLFAFLVMGIAKPTHAAFVQQGTITLCHDASRAVDWNTVAIDADAAATNAGASFAGTSVGYQVRTELTTGGATSCSASSGWTAWNTTSPTFITTKSAITIPVAVPSSRFIQIMITLKTTNTANTPVLNAVTLTDTPPGDTTAPTVPTALTGSAPSATTANLSWTASTDPDNTSSTLVYHVIRNGTDIRTTAAGATSFSDSGLTASTTYNYQVKACDPTPNCSALSAVKAVTTPPPADTTPPTVPTGLAKTGATNASVSMSWTASTDPDNATSVLVYHVFRNNTDVHTTSAGATSYTDSGLTASTSYNYTVKACDPTPNCSAQTAAVAMSTTQGPDTTPPSVSVTAPAASSTVTGSTVTLAATATDNVGGSGVKNVQFKIDGANVGTPDTTPSGSTYSVTWDSKSVTSGTHQVSAVAVDNAPTPNTGTSASVSINVVNSSVVVTSPATGPVTGTVNLSADTSGGNGAVTAVDFKVGTTVVATDSTGPTPWTGTWNSSSFAGGTYNVTAEAKAGSLVVGSSAPVAITINHPPTPPTNLGGTPSATTVALSWTASTDDVDAQSSLIYHIYRNGGATEVGHTSAGATTYTDTGLSGSTTYSYTVKASDTAGLLSPASASLSVTTTSSNNPPSTPTNLAGTTTVNSASLTWTASTDDHDASGALVYQVFRGGTLIGTTAAGATSFSDSPLSCATTYSYTLKAKDTAGLLSASSAAKSLTTAACVNQAPTAPSNLNGTASTNAASLSWTASSDPDDAAISLVYHVFRNGADVHTTTAGVTSYTDTGLTCATAYSYTVKAFDPQGASSPTSNSKALTTTACANNAPTPPTNLNGTLSALSAHLTWTASTDDTTPVASLVYHVFRGGVDIATTGAGVVSFTDATLSCGTTYSYTVKAVDSQGAFSAASAAKSLTTPGCDTSAPTVPTGLNGSTTSNTASLSWTASTDPDDAANAITYHVFRNGAQIFITTPGTTSFNDSGLSPSTNYSYQVSAYDGAGNKSALSTAKSLTTQCAGDCIAPSTPSGLAGVGTSSTTTHLSWSASTDNVAVASYIVLRGNVVIATGVTNLFYDDSGLSASTPYTYTVEAVDTSGNPSAQSAGVTITTQAAGGDTQAPSVPQNVVISAIGPQMIYISWDPSTDNVGVTKYRVFRNSSPLMDVFTNGAIRYTVGDGTVSPSQTYNYSVAAFDAAGNNATSPTTSVTTQTGSYSSQYFTQDPFLGITQGGSARYSFSFKNTSNTNWRDTSTGTPHPTVLAASHPVGRTSVFGSTWGGSNATSTFAAVYESDGVTKAASQHDAQPGQIVKFSFTLSAPSTLASGDYIEYFQPIVQGQSNMNDDMVYVKVTVGPPANAASYFTQDPFFALNRGASAPYSWQYRNTGNVNWYDTLSGNPNPTRLSTSHPVGRASDFSATWPSSSIATTLFATVFEADGVTRAANQHIAMPNQIVQFGYQMTAGSALAPTDYLEYFQPIIQGVSDLSDPNAYVKVTVN